MAIASSTQSVIESSMTEEDVEREETVVSHWLGRSCVHGLLRCGPAPTGAGHVNCCEQWSLGTHEDPTGQVWPVQAGTRVWCLMRRMETVSQGWGEVEVAVDCLCEGFARLGVCLSCHRKRSYHHPLSLSTSSVSARQQISTGKHN